MAISLGFDVPADKVFSRTVAEKSTQEVPEIDESARLASARLAEAAAAGTNDLRKAWDALPKELRLKLKIELESRHKPVAEKIDQAPAP
jgi:hypothetical protein